MHTCEGNAGTGFRGYLYWERDDYGGLSSYGMERVEVFTLDANK